MSKNLLLGYAEDFASFLLSGSYLKGYNIKNIILYGSVVRGDFTGKSDVDIFIDCLNPDKKLESEIKKSVEEFLSSVWFNKWKKLGVKNKINCLVGKLEDWKDLQRSIISNGLVLYGKYQPKKEGDYKTVFILEKIKPEKKRVFLTRKLFGYNKFGKFYPGIVEKYEGEKLSSGCFMVPIQFANEVTKMLREKKVKFRVKEFSTIG